MTNRKEQIRRWILSLVSAVVISVWADVKAYNHGIFADTPFHIAVVVIQAGIVLVLIGLIARCLLGGQQATSQIRLI